MPTSMLVHLISQALGLGLITFIESQQLWYWAHENPVVTREILADISFARILG